MDTKVCKKCSIEKSVNEFHKSARDGYRSRCKVCKKEDDIIWRRENREKDLQIKKKWRDLNKEYTSNYYINNKDIISEYNREYYLLNKENIIESSKLYYVENKDDVLGRVYSYYNRVKSSEIFRSKKREYMRKHYNNKPYLFSHRNILSRHLRWTGLDKVSNTSEMLGYTSQDLKIHIESMFVDGMSWENYGDWHIDHKKPLSKFDISELPSIVNSLDNLQPLWAYENLSKGDKYE